MGGDESFVGSCADYAEHCTAHMESPRQQELCMHFILTKMKKYREKIKPEN